ncbi:MAG: NAD(P)/FAD-dependent oxidoreductase, partial [Firmicutes bacterium]|nr:NAD(P)/FAD-dependent oxidoreductase [Bacillota bacterium]
MTAGKNENIYDVIIVGAGAAGLMCAASPAWKTDGPQGSLNDGTGRLVLEATGRAGVKLLM